MLRILMAIVFVSIAASTASAEYLVDTGTPEDRFPAYIIGSVWRIGTGAAGRFELSQPSFLTGVEGYFSAGQCWSSPGTLTAVVYGGDGTDPIFGGSIPVVSNEIFSGKISVGTGMNWYGIRGLSRNLEPGAYWLAFESREGDTFLGAMPGNAPDPLSSEAWKIEVCNWERYNSNPRPFGLGMRVAGSVVPEPLSCLLFLAGGSVLALKQKRGLQAQSQGKNENGENV